MAEKLLAFGSRHPRGCGAGGGTADGGEMPVLLAGPMAVLVCCTGSSFQPGHVAASVLGK